MRPAILGDGSGLRRLLLIAVVSLTFDARMNVDQSCQWVQQ